MVHTDGNTGCAEERPNDFASIEVPSQRPIVLHNCHEPNDDPLADAVSIKEEELDFVTIDSNDLQEINCLLKENSAMEENGVDEIERALNLPDDEIIFLPIEGANGFPKPIGELRSAIIKHEDDKISGNLCFQQTVRSAESHFYLHLLILILSSVNNINITWHFRKLDESTRSTESWLRSTRKCSRNSSNGALMVCAATCSTTRKWFKYYLS